MDKPLTVSELNTQIKSLCETTFLQICVEGEISNLIKHNSGHYYFSIKDRDSVIRCVLFRGNVKKIKFILQDAQKVIIRGGISVYTPRGEYQINCEMIEPIGRGSLHLAFEQLKKKYQELGYFDFKKKLPKFPRRVALITSNTGAALQDMLSVAQKRWGLVQLINFDTLVQGEEAKNQIAQRIQEADRYFDSPNAFDIIVVGRGGGSIEDLWPFNEEVVVEAIFKARTPIVSAVGHEIDYVMTDFVADIRAPTPSAAMEIILPEKVNWLFWLDEKREEILLKIDKVFKNKQKILKDFQYFFEKYNIENKLQYYTGILRQLEQSFDISFKNFCFQKNIGNLKQQLEVAMQKYLDKKHIELVGLLGELKSYAPKIKKGYAQILYQGKIATLQELRINHLVEIANDKGYVVAEIKQEFTKL